MGTAIMKTFIIDCPICKAKVGAIESGRADRDISEDNLFGERLIIGKCPECGVLLAGETHELDIDCESRETPWSEIVRIYPVPPRDLQGYQIPEPVLVSIREADKCLQVGANIAACAMLGRALEAVCRDILGIEVMLDKGVSQLKDKEIIDNRLFNWSQQVKLFRNDTAHPDRAVNYVSSDDAKDLQSFVYAIVEYVYILTARYDEFLERKKRREKSRILTPNPTSP